MSTNTKRLSQIAFVALISIILSGALYFELKPKPTTPETPVILNDYGLKPDFTLPSIDGSNFTLYSSNGKARLVTFIYTKCADGECNLLTANMASTMSQLQAANLTDHVQFVTIDFDYLFDNITDLTNYANTYSQPSYPWVFLQGGKNQTDTITQAWNFYFNLTSPPNTNATSNVQIGDFEYQHSLLVYVLDASSHLQYYLTGSDWSPNFAVRVIKKVLELP